MTMADYGEICLLLELNSSLYGMQPSTDAITSTTSM